MRARESRASRRRVRVGVVVRVRRRIRVGLAGWALASALGWPGEGLPPPISAQEATAPRARAVLALVPDTVRVGVPFTLGVAVRAEPGWSVRFPDSLRLGDAFEQTGSIQARQTEPDVWRADYTLVAWRAAPGPIPDVEVDLVRDGARHAATFSPPPLTVLSVLPDEGDALELRDARPFLGSGFPWWLLLLVLALLAFLAWYLLRRRARTTPVPAAAEGEGGPTTPLERALAELAELRGRWEEGDLDGATFHDGLEDVLRRYAAATREWPPGTPLGHLPNGDRELSAVLRRSASTRFGRLEARAADVVRAVDACEAWLRWDAEREAGAARVGAGPDGAEGRAGARPEEGHAGSPPERGDAPAPSEGDSGALPEDGG